MPVHVLLIDDSPLQLRVREAVLRDAGFRVSIATTAESALVLLRIPAVSDLVNVVITDHFMPDMTGVELVRTIRGIRPGLPIIVITGMPDAEADYAGLHVEFRVKPVPPPDLIQLVRDNSASAAA